MGGKMSLDKNSLCLRMLRNPEILLVFTLSLSHSLTLYLAFLIPLSLSVSLFLSLSLLFFAPENKALFQTSPLLENLSTSVEFIRGCCKADCVLAFRWRDHEIR